MTELKSEIHGRHLQQKRPATWCFYSVITFSHTIKVPIDKMSLFLFAFFSFDPSPIIFSTSIFSLIQVISLLASPFFFSDNVKAFPSAHLISNGEVGKGKLSLCTSTCTRRSNLIFLLTTEIVQPGCKQISGGNVLCYKCISHLNAFAAYSSEL